MIKREIGQYVVYTLDGVEINKAILKHVDDKYPACVSDDAVVKYVYEDGRLEKVVINNYYPEEEKE
jgi:hypothetical protein